VTSILAYVAIYIAAIIEGEIYYITQCVAVSMGKLNWLAVLIAGALGGSTGDQLWFYVLRGRLGWLDRYPRLAKYHESVRERVNANENLMVLASRFLPGLRTAIPIACAYAGVRPIKFSTLNLISAFAWAAAIMAFVTVVLTFAGGVTGIASPHDAAGAISASVAAIAATPPATIGSMDAE